MPRLTIPVTIHHPDDSRCHHKAKDPDCPGRAHYRAACNGTDCTWSTDAPIRAIVEENQRHHRAGHRDTNHSGGTR